MFVVTAKLFIGLTICQTRANGTAPKQVGLLEIQQTRAGGTARMLLRWPSMSVAAAQLSCIFYLSAPSPPHTHTPATTYSSNHVLLCATEGGI